MANNKKTTDDNEAVGYGYGEVEETEKDGKKKVVSKATVYAGKKKKLSKKARQAAAKKLLEKVGKNKEEKK